MTPSRCNHFFLSTSLVIRATRDRPHFVNLTILDQLQFDSTILLAYKNIALPKKFIFPLLSRT